MAVAKAYDVAGHGVDGDAASVGQAPLKPHGRLPEGLQEEVVQHGCGLIADLIKPGRREQSGELRSI